MEANHKNKLARFDSELEDLRQSSREKDQQIRVCFVFSNFCRKKIFFFQDLKNDLLQANKTNKQLQSDIEQLRERPPSKDQVNNFRSSA